MDGDLLGDNGRWQRAEMVLLEDARPGDLHRGPTLAWEHDVAWYPGSGSDDDDDEPTSIQTQATAVVPPVSENEQTRVHRRSNEDDPTIARPALQRATLVTEPDEPTVDDDDPTVNRKALTPNQPAVELLDQRYQLLGQLGAGGMGEVWRARHVQLARDVAIKFLTNDEGGPRFRQEAQAIAAMRHTGVVAVLDFGETAPASETSQPVPYFVMELIEGETLSARVRRQGPLSWALVRNIALEVSDALAHAHGAGIIHRDLKPSNVIVLDAPPPRGSSTKLIDFGIAKLLDEGMPKLTKKGFIQGTPAYMSPEQVLGEPVDPRADVYGLGCLLYFLLSGQRPFADKKGTAALRAQVNEMPPRFAEIAPEQRVPPDVESVVFRAMAKDKTARFASMLELHEAILAIPPDAGASLSMQRVAPSRASASASASLRTTSSYGASYSYSSSYDAPNSAEASSSGSDSVGGSSTSSSFPSTLASKSSAMSATSTMEKVKLSLAVAGSLVLILSAILALVWALTS
jgi:serine/threonine protein kinase